MYDAHANLEEELLMKVSICMKRSVSSFELRHVRTRVLEDPIKIRMEDMTLTSMGTLLRKDSKRRVALPRSHRCFQVPIYMNADLLARLKAAVTIEESSVVHRATGVPGIVHLRKDFGAFADRVDKRAEGVATTLHAISSTMGAIRNELSTRGAAIAEAVVAKIDGTYGERAHLGHVIGKKQRRGFTLKHTFCLLVVDH